MIMVKKITVWKRDWSWLF